MSAVKLDAVSIAAPTSSLEGYPYRTSSSSGQSESWLQSLEARAKEAADFWSSKLGKNVSCVYKGQKQVRRGKLPVFFRHPSEWKVSKAEKHKLVDVSFIWRMDEDASYHETSHRNDRVRYGEATLRPPGGVIIVVLATTRI